MNSDSVAAAVTILFLRQRKKRERTLMLLYKSLLYIVYSLKYCTPSYRPDVVIGSLYAVFSGYIVVYNIYNI